MTELTEIYCKELKLLYEVRILCKSQKLLEELDIEIARIEENTHYCLSVHKAEREIQEQHEAEIQELMLNRDLRKSETSPDYTDYIDLFAPVQSDSEDIETARNNKHPENKNNKEH